MRKVLFSPDAISDLKRYKSGNQSLAFKVFELITDIQSNRATDPKEFKKVLGIMPQFPCGYEGQFL